MTRSRAANDRMVLRRFLREQGGEATLSDVRACYLRPRERPWTDARIKAAVSWDESHPDSRAQIKYKPGGRGLRLVENSERVAEGRGAKAELVRAIHTESASVREIFGTVRRRASHVKAMETGKRAGPEHGSNSRPDVVVGSRDNDRQRRYTLHAIEFQGIGRGGSSTFSSSDVAQAFTSGLGSDFSWVFIHKSSKRKKSDPKFDEWERTVELAAKLGVGIVCYGNPRQVSTWNVVLRPVRQRRNDRSLRYHGWFLRLLEDHGL